jgi:hypothetical protein
MKNYYNFVVLLIILIPISGIAQEKLKGNKEVTSQNRNISGFTKIEIIDNVNVLLVYNKNQSITVETDSNLQNAILTEVDNGILTISTNSKIIRKKKLEIHIKVNEGIEEIFAYNNANVSSKNILVMDSITINAFDNSDFNLKLNSKIVNLNSKKTSNLKLDILSQETIINAEESSDVKATIDCQNTLVYTLDRASVSAEGTTEYLEIETLGNSAFKGKDYISKNALVNATNNTDIYVHATDEIDIHAKNSAKVYLYSDPKITLSEFFDKASLLKKEIQKNLF